MTGQFHNSSEHATTGFGVNQQGFELKTRTAPFVNLLIVFIIFVIVFGLLSYFVSIWFAYVLAFVVLIFLFYTAFTYHFNPLKLVSEDTLVLIQQILFQGDSQSGFKPIQGNILYEKKSNKQLPLSKNEIIELKPMESSKRK